MLNWWMELVEGDNGTQLFKNFWDYLAQDKNQRGCKLLMTLCDTIAIQNASKQERYQQPQTGGGGDFSKTRPICCKKISF